MYLGNSKNMSIILQKTLKKLCNIPLHIITQKIYHIYDIFCNFIKLQDYTKLHLYYYIHIEEPYFIDPILNKEKVLSMIPKFDILFSFFNQKTKKKFNIY